MYRRAWRKRVLLPASGELIGAAQPSAAFAAYRFGPG